MRFQIFSAVFVTCFFCAAVDGSTTTPASSLTTAANMTTANVVAIAVPCSVAGLLAIIILSYCVYLSHRPAATTANWPHPPPAPTNIVTTTKATVTPAVVYAQPAQFYGSSPFVSLSQQQQPLSPSFFSTKQASSSGYYQNSGAAEGARAGSEPQYVSSLQVGGAVDRYRAVSADQQYRPYFTGSATALNTTNCVSCGL